LKKAKASIIPPQGKGHHEKLKAHSLCGQLDEVSSFILFLFCSNFVVSFVATAATPHQNTTIGVCEFTTETYSYQYVDDNVLLIKEFQQPVVQKCPISRESFFIRPCYIELLKVY